ARRNASDHRVKGSVLRHGDTNHPGWHSIANPPRTLLPRLAGIIGAAGQVGWAGYSRSGLSVGPTGYPNCRRTLLHPFLIRTTFITSNVIPATTCCSE